MRLSTWRTRLSIVWNVVRFALDTQRTENLFHMERGMIGLLSESQVTRLSAVLLRNATFRRLYEDREQLINTPRDLDALAALPEATLGYQYAAFMRRHGLSPAFYGGFPIDGPLTFRLLLGGRAHDMHHVVLGFMGVDECHEAGVLAFYFAQSPHALNARVGIVSALLKGLRRGAAGRFHEVLECVVHGFRAGKEAKSFGVQDWDALLLEDLDAVRQQLKVRPFAQEAQREAV